MCFLDQTKHLAFVITYFKVLSYLSYFPCAEEIEVFVHMLHNNLLESSRYLWRLEGQ